MAESEDTKQDTSQKDIPKTIKIKHHKSPNFISDFATGVIFSGPTSDGMFHLVFFSDTISIDRETGQLIEGYKEGTKNVVGYKPSIDKSDIVNFREDKARIAFTGEAMARLRDLLNQHMPVKTVQEGGTDESA